MNFDNIEIKPTVNYKLMKHVNVSGTLGVDLVGNIDAALAMQFKLPSAMLIVALEQNYEEGGNKFKDSKIVLSYNGQGFQFRLPI